MSKDGKQSKAGRKEKEAQKTIEFTQQLFGRIEEMTDEEVIALSGADDPEEIVHEIASKVGTEFRLQNKVPPPQTLAALDATRPLKDFSRVTPSRLEKIIDLLLTPNSGPALRLSYSFRGKAGLNENDRTILEEASEEVRRIWSDE